MAIRKSESFNNNKKAPKKPIFDRTSKMRRYEIYFDKKEGKNKCSFYKILGKAIPFDSMDEIYTVEAGYEYRTDLISTKFYGTSKYDWVIEDVNNIEDPIKDIVAGKKLIIPDKTKIYLVT